MPRYWYLLAAYSACENWCCPIGNQYDNSFSRYHEKAVQATMEGDIT